MRRDEASIRDEFFAEFVCCLRLSLFMSLWPPRQSAGALHALCAAPQLYSALTPTWCVYFGVLSTFSTFSSLDIARQRHDPSALFPKEPGTGSLHGVAFSRKGQLLITHALPGHYHAELHEAEAPPEDMFLITNSKRLQRRPT